jgi:preprotein translocase subunit SecD
MEDTVTTEMRRGDPRDRDFRCFDERRPGDLHRRDPTQVDAAVERMRTLTQPVGLTGERDWDVGVVDQNRVVMFRRLRGHRCRRFATR